MDSSSESTHRALWVLLMAAGALGLVWLALSDVALIFAILGGSGLLLARLLLMSPLLLKNKADAQGSEAELRSAPDARILDEATGLLSRAYFETRLLEESLRCRRSGQPMVLLALRTNSAGRSAQHDLRVARALDSSLRKSDLIGSLDTGAFAVCLLGSDRHEAGPLLRRLMTQLDSAPWTVGIAVLPDDGLDGRELLELALKRSLPWRVPFWLAR